MLVVLGLLNARLYVLNADWLQRLKTSNPDLWAELGRPDGALNTFIHPKVFQMAKSFPSTLDADMRHRCSQIVWWAWLCRLWLAMLGSCLIVMICKK